MRPGIAIASLAIASLAAPSSSKTVVAAGPVWREAFPRNIFDRPSQRPVVIAGDSAVVTLTQPTPRSDGQPSDADARIVVQFPGVPAYTVPTDENREAAFGIWVGIGRMAESDGAPTILIAGYTGGMHCCSTLQTVSLVDGNAVSHILPRADSSGPGFKDDRLAEFPLDLNGDGMRDIVWSDDSLLYEFTSYAAGRTVPRIYNLRAGRLVDVSRALGFAALYDDFAHARLAECQGLRRSANAGMCAAYAYAMAVRGRAEEGIRTATALATESSVSVSACTTNYVDFECPKGEAIAFRGFERSLRSLMQKNGYLQ